MNPHRTIPAFAQSPIPARDSAKVYEDSQNIKGDKAAIAADKAKLKVDAKK